MSKKKQICIIKLGAIGDVLRTTPILWNFCKADVVWVTEKPAFALLRNIPGVKKIVAISDLAQIKQLVFDEIYNFDEDQRACLLANALPADKKKGFTFKNGSYQPFDADAEYAFALSKNDELKFKLNQKTYQQLIFEMAGFLWKGQDYLLGYRPRSKIKYDIGINYRVGKKFPNKAWPHWKRLAKLLNSACLQTEFKTLEGYMDWINSCRIIVTGDSLGMHLALALKKKVVILMGSTSWNEIETYNRGMIIHSQLACAPCYKKVKCRNNPFCMELLTPEAVCAAIKKIRQLKP